MEQVETMNALTQFLSQPIVAIICAILLLILGALALLIMWLSGVRESDVRKAQAKTRSIQMQSEINLAVFKDEYIKLGAEKFALAYEVKRLKREVDRLNYSIEQLTKGASHVSADK